MTATPPNTQEDTQDSAQTPVVFSETKAISQAEIDSLTQQLRRKEGNWVAWGKACHALQKTGMDTQVIFETTGFEPIQQNQLVVAAQVFDAMVSGGVSDQAKAHYETRGSDSLYEFRILPNDQRAAAADFAFKNGLDSEQVKEVIKGLKEFSYKDQPPAGFEKTMGDGAAYYYWRLAKQQGDLQERSRLIAQSLRFATSSSARSKIEKLLTDFTVTQKKPAPRLPIFRLEDEADSPLIVPVAGALPLATEDYRAVPSVESERPFGMVKFSGTGAWVPVPGWQVILSAEDPVAILAGYDRLPNAPEGVANEPVLVVIDRAKRQWDEFSYFVVDADGQLSVQWFEEAPETKLLGGVVLVMRPKRIWDETYNADIWQIDE